MILALLGTKQGGSRTIALASTFCRLPFRILIPAVREWDARIAGDFESAVRGRSPHTMVMQRQLPAEIVRFCKRARVELFWDMAKLYETMLLNILAE